MAEGENKMKELTIDYEHAVPDMERSVFKWTKQQDHFKERKKIEEQEAHVLMTGKEVVEKYGVPRDELKKYLEMELTEAENFASLPSTMLFVIAYACVVIVHDDAVVIRAVEHSIDFDIEDNANFAFDSSAMAHKAIMDVNSYTDFWSFSSIGLLPLLLPQETGVSEMINPDAPAVKSFILNYTMAQRGTYLLYDRIVGGVRFQQQQANDAKCIAESAIVNFFYGRRCYGQHYEIEPEKGLWYERIQKPVAKEWFFTYEDTDVHMKRLKDMELGKWVNGSRRGGTWLNDTTTRIEIALPIYTGEFGLHTLVTINFYFSRSGHIWKQIVPLSAYAEWWAKWYYGIYDGIFVLCLVHLFKTEVTEVFTTIRDTGISGIWTEYAGFWNVIDWISIVSGMVVVFLALLSRSSTSKVNNEAIALSKVSTSNRPAYLEQSDKYLEALSDLCQYFNILRLLMSAYPLIIVIRLFKAFKSQPRLALVTKTLSVTGVDLMHFMVVFTSVFMILCISGMVLFGRRVDSFTTFARTINTVFRMMLGDFDWDDLRVTGYIDGFIWLMVTLGILNLLLLNMVLAIVMDGYSEVKKGSISSDTLFQEIQAIITQWWNVRQGQWVTLRLVKESLDDLDDKWEEAQAARHRGADDSEVRSQPSSEVETSTPLEDKPILLGHDSKILLDMKVEPVEKAIRDYVGPGKIHTVGVNSLRVRVLHDNGNIREYDTGNDLNFELRLVAGEEAVPFEDDEDNAMASQVISPERLMKIVSAYDKTAFMKRSQAVFLLDKTVRHYYKEHSEDVDWGRLRTYVCKAEFRLSRIKGMLPGLHKGGEFMTPTDEMKVLRQYMKEFFEAVHNDRQKTLSEIYSKYVEVRALRKKLLMVESQVLSGNYDNRDRRTRQGLGSQVVSDVDEHLEREAGKAPSDFEDDGNVSLWSPWPMRSTVTGKSAVGTAKSIRSSFQGSEWPVTADYSSSNDGNDESRPPSRHATKRLTAEAVARASAAEPQLSQMELTVAALARVSGLPLVDTASRKVRMRESVPGSESSFIGSEWPASDTSGDIETARPSTVDARQIHIVTDDLDVNDRDNQEPEPSSGVSSLEDDRHHALDDQLEISNAVSIAHDVLDCHRVPGDTLSKRKPISLREDSFDVNLLDFTDSEAETEDDGVISNVSSGEGVRRSRRSTVLEGVTNAWLPSELDSEATVCAV